MRDKKYRGDLDRSEDLLYPFSSSEISFRKICKYYTSKGERANIIDKNTKEDIIFKKLLFEINFSISSKVNTTLHYY